jgi:hypothetical protein
LVHFRSGLGSALNIAGGQVLRYKLLTINPAKQKLTFYEVAELVNISRQYIQQKKPTFYRWKAGPNQQFSHFKT